ncbi:uncharacterized protein YukE [Streptacidiphilus sp. MAP12-16]|uniref:WXG100 family type VII secretion target n=1 Tax=Streptacidiphilus sp. MAP12-16 TaxID=3156300 RepID=UPI0035149320
MLVRDSSGDGWSATTNFETLTHEQLHAMVADANPAGVMAVGTALSDASTHIQSIADDLAHHITNLAWESDAGTTFKGWAQQVISATDTLSIYASNTGVAISMAGETLSSVKPGMPPVPVADMATVSTFKQQHVLDSHMVVGLDGKILQPGVMVTPTTLPSPGGITQAQAYQAQTRIDAAHQEAIGQMEKLGGSYVGANATLGVSTIPNFPPTPGTLMPPQGSGYSTSGNTTGVGGGSSTNGGVSGGYTTVRTSTGTRRSSGGSDSHSGTGGTTFAPVNSPTHGTAGGAPAGGGTTTLQGTSAPTAPAAPTGSTGTGGTGPSRGGTGGGGLLAPPPAGGGAGVTGTAEPGPRQGKGGTLGTGSEPTARGAKSGIHGGEPDVPTAGRSSRLGAQAIGASGGGAGGSGFSRGGGIGGSATGRAGSGRVSGETGAAENSGSSSARSGLGVGAAAGERPGASSGEGSGMMPMGGGGTGGASGRGRGRGGRRAAYLMEDEETWAPDDSGVNPSVIE